MDAENGDEKLATPQLFMPGRLGCYFLPTRIVMAPMTRNRVGRDGVPTPMTVTYYSQRASSALIITEATQISPQGVGYPNTPGIHSPEQIAGWREVVDAVHRLGSRIFLQLFHAGRVSHPSLQPGGAPPVAPSELAPEGETMTYGGLQPFATPRALERGEISGIVDQFGIAARNARVAGFDGVEIHAANGYLLDQFLRDGSNRRADEYGGPIENRLRLLKEVTEVVVMAWGGDRVGVRLSPLNLFNSMKDSSPAKTFLAAVECLNRLNLAYLHLVEEGGSASSRASFNWTELKKIWQGTLVVNGGYDRERAEAALATASADFVSFGRLFIANPDLPARFRNGAPLSRPDRASFYGGDEHGYIDYAFLGEGTERALKSPPQRPPGARKLPDYRRPHPGLGSQPQRSCQMNKEKQQMKFFMDTHDKTKGTFPAKAISEQDFFDNFDALEKAAEDFRAVGHAAHVNLEEGKAFCLMSGPDKESIRKAHEAINFPYDSITEIKRVTGADFRPRSGGTSR